MAIVNKSKTVSYTPSQMFALIDDINSYAEFLPWCSESVEHLRDKDFVKASIVISAGGIKKSFTTQNRLQAGKMIEIRLVDGPFKHLEGFWRFEPLENNQCQITFDLEFEFSNKLLSMALGPVFQQVTTSMLDAFCKRADEIYTKANEC